MSEEEFFNKVTLGKRIRARRMQLGLKRKNLVTELYPLNYLREVEEGRLQPSLDFLVYIARCLDLTVSELEAETKLHPRPSTRAAYELHLMNAHVAIQTHQPDKALSYLAMIKPGRLRGPLLADYYDISGQVKIALRQYDEGRADLEEALQLLETLPKIEVIKVERVRNWIGLSYYRQQNYEQALEHHRLCLNAIILGKIEDLRFKMLIQYNLANEYHAMGDQTQSLHFYYEAASLAEEAEEINHLAGIYWGIGVASKYSQDLKTAMIYFAKSATLYAELGEEKFAAQVKGFLGLTLIERKEYNQAEINLKSALSTAIRLGENAILIYVYVNLSHLYLRTNQLDKAEYFANEGLIVARKIDEPLALGQALYSLGMVKLPQGKPDEAIGFYSQAEAVLKITEAWTYLEKVYVGWQEALLATNQKDAAFEIYQKAFECREKLKLLGAKI